MSGRDIQFINNLNFTPSEVARILNVSRQSVSRGLRSDKDYLDQRKLMRISDAAQRVFAWEPSEIDRLIHKFYRHYKEDMKRLSAGDAINLSIDSDFYFSCTKLPYYMSVYQKLFLDLKGYIRASHEHDLYFSFPDPETLRYSREKLLKWIGDERIIAHSYVVVCPAIAVFPFSVCGTYGKKPVVYFCDADGFVAQNENNSRWIVTFIKKFLDGHKSNVKKL